MQQTGFCLFVWIRINIKNRAQNPDPDVTMKMERWYGVKITIEDEKLASERLSGSIRTETIQQAMEALQFSTSFHYELKSDLITITK